MASRTTSPRRRSLAGRVVLALVLMAGFYTLVLGVALALVAAPLLGWLALGDLHLELFGAVVLGLALLWAILPRREPVDLPGHRIERVDQPELWQLIEKVASVMHQKVPEEIYLLDEMNVYVADLGGVMGVGGRRVMGLGLPLMRVLDAEEFASVIAHELGHLHVGGARFGPFIYRSRESLIRTLGAARPSPLPFVFSTYAQLYLRVTAAVARSQEMTADTLAATATSTVATAGALARLPFGSVAFEVYLRDEYLPVLGSGHQPPFLEGFEVFLTSTVAQEHLRHEDAAALGATAGSRFDGHPSVPERLEALGADGADLDDRPLPEVPVMLLLRGADGIEEALVQRHVPLDTRMRPIAWAEVGERVLAPAWAQERASLVGELPGGFHLGALPLDADGLAELGDDVGRNLRRSLSRSEREAYGHHVARAIIGEVAVAHGMAVEMVPGEPVWFGLPPEQFGLLSAYDDVVEGRAEPHVWFEVIQEAGLTARRAVADVAAEAPPAPTPVPAAEAPPAPAPVELPAETAPTTQAPAIPRPAGPSNDENHQRFLVPVGIGRRYELVVAGASVTWRGVTVWDEDICHLAYTAEDPLEVRLWTADFELRVRMSGGGRHRGDAVPAWQALVRWTESRVEGRLVDAHLDRLAERGRVTVADQVLTRNGVVVRGRVVPWEVLAPAEFDGRDVRIAQRIEHLDGVVALASVDAGEPDAVLLPTLIAAAASAATSTAPG